MSQDLAQALKNPSVVLVAGPRPGVRNSTKKASGLLRFGAGVMLGVALLSPFNALAQSQHHVASAWQQTTEVVAQPEAARAGFEAMTLQQLEQMLAEGQKPDWFGIEVDGRNWANHGAQVGVAVNVPAWVRHGHLPGVDGPAMAGGPEQVVIGDGSRAEHVPEQKRQDSYSEHMAAYEARVLQEKIAARRDGAKFELGRNSMDLEKAVAMGSKDLAEASPEKLDQFVAALVKNAYIELQAGHTVESPSQRLMDVCQHINDVSQLRGPSSQIEHSREAFAACSSETMQSNMTVNTVKRYAGFAGVIVGTAVAKTIALGSLFFAGQALLGSSSNAFSDRLAERRRKSGGPGPDPGMADGGTPRPGGA